MADSRTLGVARGAIAFTFYVNVPVTDRDIRSASEEQDKTLNPIVDLLL